MINVDKQIKGGSKTKGNEAFGTTFNVFEAVDETFGFALFELIFGKPNYLIRYQAK